MKQDFRDEFDLISVVIPAYKQEKTIVEDVKRIVQTLDEIRFNYEIIVVVDGSPDATFERVKSLESTKVKVVTYEKNQGKGYAVRFGMKLAKGDPIAFIDAGMDLNPNGLAILFEQMIWNQADIVVGSKRHHDSKVHYPLFRRVQSFMYQTLVFLLFGLKVRDTQVGLKLYRKKVVARIVHRCVINRFAFDVEMLAVANSFGFKKIMEAPIEVEYNFASTIRPKSVFEVLRDTFRVYVNLLSGYYKN